MASDTENTPPQATVLHEDLYLSISPFGTIVDKRHFHTSLRDAAATIPLSLFAGDDTKKQRDAVLGALQEGINGYTDRKREHHLLYHSRYTGGSIASLEEGLLTELEDPGKSFKIEQDYLNERAEIYEGTAEGRACKRAAERIAENIAAFNDPMKEHNERFDAFQAVFSHVMTRKINRDIDSILIEGKYCYKNAEQNMDGIVHTHAFINNELRYVDGEVVQAAHELGVVFTPTNYLPDSNAGAFSPINNSIILDDKVTSATNDEMDAISQKICLSEGKGITRSELSLLHRRVAFSDILEEEMLHAIDMTLGFSSSKRFQDFMQDVLNDPEKKAVFEKYYESTGKKPFWKYDKAAHHDDETLVDLAKMGSTSDHAQFLRKKTFDSEASGPDFIEASLGKEARDLFDAFRDLAKAVGEKGVTYILQGKNVQGEKIDMFFSTPNAKAAIGEYGPTSDRVIIRINPETREKSVYVGGEKVLESSPSPSADQTQAMTQQHSFVERVGHKEPVITTQEPKEISWRDKVQLAKEPISKGAVPPALGA